MKDLFMPAGSFESKKAKIKVIGVGGGGGNAINHMVNAGIKEPPIWCRWGKRLPKG